MTLPVLLPAFKTTIHSAAMSFADAVDALRDLPDTSDKIAALFEGIGIKGCPCSGTGCAVAEYVRVIMWPDDEIEVSIMDLALQVVFEDTEFLFSLPAHVAEFVKHFDDGKYPTLTAEECVK